MTKPVKGPELAFYGLTYRVQWTDAAGQTGISSGGSFEVGPPLLDTPAIQAAARALAARMGAGGRISPDSYQLTDHAYQVWATSTWPGEVPDRRTTPETIRHLVVDHPDPGTVALSGGGGAAYWRLAEPLPLGPDPGPGLFVGDGLIRRTPDDLACCRWVAVVAEGWADALDRVAGQFHRHYPGYSVCLNGIYGLGRSFRQWDATGTTLLGRVCLVTPEVE